MSTFIAPSHSSIYFVSFVNFGRTCRIVCSFTCRAYTYFYQYLSNLTFIYRTPASIFGRLRLSSLIGTGNTNQSIISILQFYKSYKKSLCCITVGFSSRQSNQDSFICRIFSPKFLVVVSIHLVLFVVTTFVQHIRSSSRISGAQVLWVHHPVR